MFTAVFKTRLTNSVDELKTRFRRRAPAVPPRGALVLGLEPADQDQRLGPRVSRLGTPEPEKLGPENSGELVDPGLESPLLVTPGSTQDTNISTPGESVSSAEVALLDDCSILPESSIMLKSPLSLDLDRPLPPRPCHPRTLKTQIADLQEETLEAANSMKEQETLLVDEMRELGRELDPFRASGASERSIEALSIAPLPTPPLSVAPLNMAALSALTPAPAPLLHKRSTRSTLFARVQCAEHDAYQLRIENELMSKRAARGQQWQEEFDDLQARNRMLSEELDTIETLQSRSESEPHGSDIQTFTTIQLKLVEELQSSRKECQRLNERVQQAESSYHALYTSFKTIQSRYRADFEQINGHLLELQQPHAATLDDMYAAQEKLMQSQKQLLRLQEYFSGSILAAKSTQIDQTKLTAIFNILEPLLAKTP